MKKEAPLSQSQQKAIAQVKGPCIILAGAGTGKTHTIVEKIKHLINKEIYNPEKIVCITFSNEAANNLLTRVRSQLDLPQDKEPIIKTFHALSSTILKNHGQKIGIPKDFEILDPDEAKILLHTNLKIPTTLCHRYVAALSTAKDLGITHQDLKDHLAKNNPLQENLKEKLESLQLELHTTYSTLSKEKKSQLKQKVKATKALHDLEKFITSWSAYEKIKDQKDLQDYSDLNNNALHLLKQHPDITDEIEYIIIDEFQDTNKIQLDMLFALAKNKNITVVGDLNQSIYQFRGAYEENIAHFKKHFGITNKEIYNLDKSFRSPNKILALAHQLILNNYTDPALCFEVKNAHARPGEPVEIYELNNAKEESRKIIELISQQVAHGTPHEQICVLYRTHQQSRTIKRALEAADIPFIAIGKSSLLKQKSVKITIDYITILKNLMKKEQSGMNEWWDVMYQTNFAKEDLIKITEFIKSARDSENYNAKILAGLDKLLLSQEGRLRARSITDRIKLLIPLYEKPLVEFLEHAYPIIGVFHDPGFEKKESILNINKFHELAKKHAKQHYPQLDSFLHHLGVMNELGIELEAAEIEASGVRLMTSHATKGLEFKTVILTNLAEKRFPLESRAQSSLIPQEIIQQQKSLNQDRSIEEYEKHAQLLEERRLCYVSFTRAKEDLFITYAKEYAQRKTAPSQFLREINYTKNNKTIFTKDAEDKVKPEEQITTQLRAGGPGTDQPQNLSSTQIDITKKAFSPSSLLIFKDCQKRFEYKYIYNMPEKITFSMEAAKIGSFVHLILQKGVTAQVKTLKEFKDLALTLHAEEEWESVDLSEALLLIKVFFERNKHKVTSQSQTERALPLEIEGLKFIGFADRIDTLPDNTLEIVDYKTGKSSPSPLQRNFQLGYYALAAEKIGNVKKLTLDMLRHPTALEFEIDDSGLAATASGRMSFNIHEIKAELTDTAKEIIKAYKEGFKPCSAEKNCQFCEEYVY